MIKDLSLKKSVTFNGKLPGLNEIIKASKAHWACYSKMKKEHTDMFIILTKNFPKFEEVHIKFNWYYKNATRDPDNMMAGQKFVLDALVKNGIIPDDTGKYIKTIVHHFDKCSEDAVELTVSDSPLG